MRDRIGPLPKPHDVEQSFDKCQHDADDRMLLSETEYRLLDDMSDYVFVDQPDTLTPHIANQARLAIDTEFMREKTYFAQLCLLQVASEQAIWCVDPLADGDMRTFWSALLDKNWVVHSARQDIEVVFQTTHTMPNAIFDTQVAAAMLGMPTQIGYAGLVKELFDTEMAKSHTRADWTRRPLPQSYLEYAAEDVEYLLPAADILCERLERTNRLEWAVQDSALLLNPALYDTGSDQAIDRLKGARNFRGKRRAAAARLAVWRELEAIKRNRPRQWIMRDNVLLDVAYKLPKTMKQLSAIDGISAKLANRAGEVLLREVRASETDENGYEPPRPPDEAQKALLKEMQARVAACAAELDLAAETIASKRELSSVIISGSRESRVFTGWRSELIGNDLLTLL